MEMSRIQGYQESLISDGIVDEISFESLTSIV